MELEEVGYYSTGPNVMYSSDKVYLILTHRTKCCGKKVSKTYVVTTSWLITMAVW